MLQDLKNKKLMLSLILVLALALCIAIPVIASADGSASVTVGSTSTAMAPGGSVTIPVTIANNPGIAGYGLTISYDSTNLILTSVSNTGSLCSSGLFNVDTSTAGKAYIIWATGSGTDMNSNGDLFDLNFTAKDTATTGNYNVSCALTNNAASSFINNTENNVVVSFTAGNIQIEAPAVTPTAFTGSVVAAPLADHAAEPQTTLYDMYSVSYENGTASVTATNLRSHTNANDAAGYWVGVGLAVPSGTNYADIKFGTAAGSLSSAGMTGPGFSESGTDYAALYVEADNATKSRTFYVSFDGGTTVYAITIDCTNVTLYTPPSSSTTIALADFASGVYTISAGGEYTVAADAAGTIEITTTDEVTLVGSGITAAANTNLFIDYTVAGADLEIKNLNLVTSASTSSFIDFTGIGNDLTLSGTSMLENNSSNIEGGALIHVPSTADLTISGTGTLYFYRKTITAGIGGNSGETNGTITINGGTIFGKGNSTGATIGGGQSANGGTVIINGGVVNLMSNARGAVVGGGGASGGVYGEGGTVYVNGGTVLLNSDFTGSSIGPGGENTIKTASGTLYVSGGSLKTVADSNALSAWGVAGSGDVFSQAVINTAAKLNNDTEKANVYLLTFDTAQLTTPADNFTVDVDDQNNFYVGAGHKWKLTKSTTTLENWSADTDTNLYLYVTGKDHTLTVNGEAFDVTWDSENKTFSVAVAPDYWDGTADTSWYNTTDTVFHLTTPEQLAGLAKISSGIGQTAQGAAIAFDDFTGKTIYLDNDIWLNDHTSTGQDANAKEWQPIAWAYYVEKNQCTPFNGTLNGQGHTIYNMYQYSGLTFGSTDEYMARGNALIGYSAEACVVKNLTITGYTYGNRYASGIVGKVGTKGASYSATVGPGTIIENCANYVNWTATGTRGSGGIAGSAWNHATIRNCVNYGNGIGGYDKSSDVGGIVGEIEGLVENCVNYGNISTNRVDYRQTAGGIVGLQQASFSVVRNCYNLGSVSAGTAGGIQGYNSVMQSLYNCYNLGTVTGAVNAGAVIGQTSGTITAENLYALEGTNTVLVGPGTASGTSNGTIGFFQMSNSEGANYMSSAALLSKVNGEGTAYAGRSFVADSAVSPTNNGYPVLRAFTHDTSTLTSIAITTAPTKTAYNATEVFDPTAMVVRAYYSDNTSEAITDYTYPTGGLEAGATSVTISYGGKSTTQAITVNALALDSIAITTAPTKTYYVNGDSFDKTGMVVKATYNSTVVQTLAADDYTVTPDPLTTGTQAVTVSYTYQGVTKTAAQTITVMEALPTLADGYYQLEDAQDLLWFADYVSVMGNTTACAKLINDITLTSTWIRPIGTITNKFAGTFDGNNKTISGLTNASVNSANFGLFGYALGATVQNLSVSGDISGAASYAGLVAGYGDGCTFSHVTASGFVTGTANSSYLGGIAGYATNAATFTDCVNNVSVTAAAQYAGGIAGCGAGSASFTNCTNNGTVSSTSSYAGGIAGQLAGTGSLTFCINKGTVSGQSYVGGLVGTDASTGTVSKCYNSGIIGNTTTAGTSANYYTGGVVGGLTAAGTIDQCYNSGVVKSYCSSAGGVAGCVSNAAAIVKNSYNLGSVTSTRDNSNVRIGGVIGNMTQADATVQNCYSTGKITTAGTSSSNVAGVIGYAAGLTNVSNNYYLDTSASQATGNSASTESNAVAQTSSVMSSSDLVTLLGSAYQAGEKYPVLVWQKVETGTGDVTVEDGGTVEIGSNQGVNNIVLNSGLVAEMNGTSNLSMTLTTASGEFAFDAAATSAIVAAAGNNAVNFNATQLTESNDSAIQALLDSGAMVFDFSLTANNTPVFSTAGSGRVTVKIPYVMGNKTLENIRIYYINSEGRKTQVVPITYEDGYLVFSVSHFSTYAIEYGGLNIWAAFPNATVDFNGGNQIAVKIYAKNETATTYGSYQADVDFNGDLLTFNSSASTMEAGTSSMTLYADGKARIGYSSESSTAQDLSAVGTLLATLVFDVKTGMSDGVTDAIGLSNASFRAPGDASDQTASVGADIHYTLHNLKLAFQGGTGNTLTNTDAYVKYNQAGLYTDDTYVSGKSVPVPTANSGYRLAKDTVAEPLWKNAALTGYTSAAIAAAAFDTSQTFTAQSVKTGSSISQGSTGKAENSDGTEENPTEPTLPTFTDVQKTDWYYNAVKFAVSNGLFTGTTATTFEPQATMTRDMLVTVLYRLAGKPAVSIATNSFSDVASGAWYADAVAWATANKIVTGYENGKFGPADAVTREQMMAILYRYSSLKGYDISAAGSIDSFTDRGAIEDYALPALKWAVGKGLINGRDNGTLAPGGNATRAEVATILMRFANMLQ